MPTLREVGSGDREGLTTVPSDYYELKIEQAIVEHPGTSSRQYDQIRVWLRVQSGHYENALTMDTYSLSPRALWKISADLLALGADPDFDILPKGYEEVPSENIDTMISFLLSKDTGVFWAQLVTETTNMGTPVNKISPRSVTRERPAGVTDPLSIRKVEESV